MNHYSFSYSFLFVGFGLFLILGTLQMTGGDQKASTQLVLYTQPSFLEIFSQESRHFDLCGKNWTIVQDWNQLGVVGVVWEAALVLAHYIEEHKELIKDSKVIELGAGTGLVSMIASTLGAKSVIVTDREMKSIERNLEVNRHNLINADIKAVPFEWGRSLSSSLSSSPSFDVILGADIIYIEDTYRHLIASLELLCPSSSSTVVLLSVKERYTKVDDFFRLLTQTGKFSYTLVHRERSADIYRIVRKTGEKE